MLLLGTAIWIFRIVNGFRYIDINPSDQINDINKCIKINGDTIPKLWDEVRISGVDHLIEQTGFGFLEFFLCFELLQMGFPFCFIFFA